MDLLKRMVVIVLVAQILMLPNPAFAQAAPSSPAGRGSSAAKRIVWSLIGAGIGFGAGLMFGLNKFDDAVNSDRKVWMSALGGAAIGGIAGGVLSRDTTPGFMPKRPAAPRRKDPLWQGMAAGAAAGAAVGLFVVPARECKPENPECPTMLRIGVGIPAMAVGAALGAAIDKLR